MSDKVQSEFPIWGLLPKKETGVTQFLSKYPTYDGRGITIAIFDSGVDPGAAGLETTTDGKTKVIERFDCSGAGDVDTSTIVTTDNKVITGLTGRKLKIPPNTANPEGKWHIGVKKAFELYPSKLMERVMKDRKEKLWDPTHKAVIAAAARKLQEYENGHGDNNSSSGLEKLVKDDREAELELINGLEKKITDQGPVYDCVVFHDGETWRAFIDTSERGDLASGLNLGEYSITNEFAPLTVQDQLNVSVNVYNGGNILEIVSICSAHGTHVASIAAAHFPDNPDMNGVAPGAQIISLTIGDSRLSSMETGTALVRAMIKVMQRTGKKPVHVINMSYGEHAHWANSGRIGELMAEVVGKHNVNWVVSAGNHGPALCTIGAPPDISTDCVIGVGAYVSPEMMVAEYAMREKLPGMPYTWSSRGPTIDGGMGVSVCAPGGAITSVPNFTLRSAQLMNGTSMASPHVAGAIALLLSGCLQQGIETSPHSVKRALENTAQFQPDLDFFAQGNGLLQVEKAFERLCDVCGSIDRDVRFSVQCGTTNGKGIHLRGGLMNRPVDCLITVEPIFHDEAPKDRLINFNLRLCLTCPDGWVQTASHLDLTNLPRMLTVRIDPSGLKEGVHTSSIKGYDTACIGKGPVFNIPITVVKPIVLSPDSPPELSYSVTFKPNTIRRHFILVPEQATFVVLRLKSPDKDKSGKFVVHCVQLRPKQVVKSLEFHKMFNLSASSDLVQAFPCKGGLVLEVVVAKFWASLGDMIIDYSIEFRGARPDCQSVTMQGADGIHSIELYSGLKTEEIAPAISIKSSVFVVRPSESKIIACCHDRDVIPPCRQIYENILTYNIHICKSTEITPSCPILCDLLYESEFESQLWILYDSNKQLISAGDAYPAKYSVKVEKGDYVLKLNVRHERRDLLEKLSDTPCLISQKLCQPLALDVYISYAQAMIQGKKMVGAIIPPGCHVLPIYIAPLTSDKATKNVPFGHYLQGTISYSKDELGKKADVYTFKYVIPESVKKSKGTESKDKEKEKPKIEEYADSVRDVKIAWLSKLEAGPEALSVYEELKTSYPDNLQVHIAMLNCLDSLDIKKPGVLPIIGPHNFDEEKVKEMRKTNLNVIEIADRVIDMVDTTQLLSHMGMKADGRPEASKIKQSTEKQKIALIDALTRRGCALARMLGLELNGRQATEEELEPISGAWREIIKFVDANDLKVANFMAWHAVLSGQYARTLRFLNKMAEEKNCKELELKIAEVYHALRWLHAERYLLGQLPIKYPSAYRRF